MPFACAKAVCATFCAAIAGALIPIFGPDFPSQCISPDAPEHGRMSIDPAIITESAREAELFRRMYANVSSVAASNHLPQHRQHHQHHVHYPQMHNGGVGISHQYSQERALPSPTSIPSPRLGRRALNVQQRYGSRHEFERERAGFDEQTRFERGPSSTYGTDSEPETHPGTEMASLSHHLHRGGLPYPPLSPPRSSGNGNSWTVVNHPPPPPLRLHPHPHPQHPYTSPTPTSAYTSIAYREGELPHPTDTGGGSVPGPNPFLSAIPRFGHSQRFESHQHHHQPQGPFHEQQRLPSIHSSVLSAWKHGDASTLPRYQNHHNIPILHPLNISTTAKRPAVEVGDAEYDDYSSSEKSSPATTATSTTSPSLCSQQASALRRGSGGGPEVVAGDSQQHHDPESTGAEKNAALLLMNLSVRSHADMRRCTPAADTWDEIGPRYWRREDCGGGGSRAPRGCGPESMSMSPVSGATEGHRSKRRRATSM